MVLLPHLGKPSTGAHRGAPRRQGDEKHPRATRPNSFQTPPERGTERSDRHVVLPPEIRIRMTRGTAVRPRHRRGRELGGELGRRGGRLRLGGQGVLRGDGHPDRVHGRRHESGNGGTRRLAGWSGGAGHRRCALGGRAVSALVAGCPEGRGLVGHRSRARVRARAFRGRRGGRTGIRSTGRRHVHVLRAQRAGAGQAIPAERARQGDQEQQQLNRSERVRPGPEKEAAPHAWKDSDLIAAWSAGKSATSPIKCGEQQGGGSACGE
jgi:hypothetical protein